jgi:hypothetical protein
MDSFVPSVRFADDPTRQPQGNCLPIRQFPNYISGIPLAAYSLHLLSHFSLLRRDLKSHHGIFWLSWRRRFPITLLNNEFHGLPPLLFCLVVPISYTYQPVPIPVTQLLSTILVGLRGQTGAHRSRLLLAKKRI